VVSLVADCRVFGSRLGPRKSKNKSEGSCRKNSSRDYITPQRGGGANLSFLEALFFARQQQCFLPHHHVYGILSLFDLGKISLDIQYEQPGQEATSKAEVELSQSLNILSAHKEMPTVKDDLFEFLKMIGSLHREASFLTPSTVYVVATRKVLNPNTVPFIH
jgi:hypothetical protein